MIFCSNVSAALTAIFVVIVLLFIALVASWATGAKG